MKTSRDSSKPKTTGTVRDSHGFLLKKREARERKAQQVSLTAALLETWENVYEKQEWSEEGHEHLKRLRAKLHAVRTQLTSMGEI